MDRALFSRCLKGIEASFSCNEARTNAVAFSHRQLNVVCNAATSLCRIDPHDSIAIAQEQLNFFVHHAKRILRETAAYTSTKHGKQQIFQNRVAETGSLSEHELRRMAQLRNNAMLSLIMSMGTHNILNEEETYFKELVSQMDISQTTVQSMVALVGCIHKSELFKKSYVWNFTGNIYRTLASCSSHCRQLTSRECSLLLWRKLAMVYMTMPMYSLNHPQVKFLVYQCYEKIKDEILTDLGNPSGDVLAVLEEDSKLYPPIRSVASKPLYANHGEEERSILKIKSTLSNISQAAIILFQLRDAQNGNHLLRDMSLSTLVRLDRMLKLAQCFGTRKQASNGSSDTHTKVLIAIRDIIDRNDILCRYEQPVGISSYTLDVLLTAGG